MVSQKVPSPLQFRKTLLRWFEKSRRDLPWRNMQDPYAIWISEIMLQQTQVERVKDFYLRFLKRFPTVRVLAKASWPEVLEYWRGLGYYRRARNLHRAAQVLVEQHKGKFPQNFKELQKLPGIGVYTAAAIASFAFGEDIPAIDTNLRRVFEHIFGNEFVHLPPQKQFDFVQRFFVKGKGALMNHALMDLGTVLAKGSQGIVCPFHKKEIIVPKNKLSKNSVCKKNLMKVAAGVIIQNGKVLISQRVKNTTYGGFWEFPGGKLEPGEDERSCLKREIQEELGIEVAVRPAFYRVDAFDRRRGVALSFHRCSILLGEPKALQVKTFRWVDPSELFDYRFPPVNKEVIKILLSKKAMFRS